MGSDVTFSQAQSVALPALPPQSPGVTAYSLRSTQKEEARRAADTPGFFALPPWEMRGEMEKRFPQRLP